MCGIAGIVAADGFDSRLLISMTKLICHRGPDGFGCVFFEGGAHGKVEIVFQAARLPRIERPVVGLGHRRLAILDLSALGSQPMCTDDGTLHITHNGEIYNFLELRDELKARGYSFKTQTDTEVILQAYREWGCNCLTRFNGMWSFALLDRQQQRLFCARDRFGEKPFYYWASNRCFVFGSEIKQILEFPDVTRLANERAVFGYLDKSLLDQGDETFFFGIHQLPGGHLLTIDLAHHSFVPRICRYWELTMREPRPLSVGDACEEFRARFKKAVNLRLRSDVPVGACLSGGLDSSSVVCQARTIIPDNTFHTFSACFAEDSYDERKYSSEIVAATGVTPHLIFPDPERFWQRFERVIWHQDEPVASTNVYAQWCVMESARQQGIPVLLDGQGGDETLCGYQKFYYFYLWYLFRQASPRIIPEAMLWVKNHTRSRWTWEDATKYLPWHLTRASPVLDRVCCQALQGKSSGNGGGPHLGPRASIGERQKVDLISTSLPALLHYEDRNAMAHSVEARLPFLDHELAEFLVNCPASYKLRYGWSKWILRHSLAGIVPDGVRLRKTKLGFDTPLAEWMRQGLRAGLRDFLSTHDLQMTRFLVKKNVVRELDRFVSCTPGSLHAALLFRVLTLELWARVHKVS